MVNATDSEIVKGAASRAIAYARAFTGMSQKELAAKSKIDQSDISKLERGLSNPSVSTLERIASAMGGRLEISIVFDNDQKVNKTISE